MFIPDYTLLTEAAHNRRPLRLPLYEHIVSPAVMEQVLGEKFAQAIKGSPADRCFFFERYCRFFREMTYDTVSFEAGIADILPDHGAIFGGRPGPVQTRQDFERYPSGYILAGLREQLSRPCPNNSVGDESGGRGGLWCFRDQRRPCGLRAVKLHAGG